MKRSKQKKERVSLLPFLYKALPLCLVSLALLNLWFIYNFVNRERVTLDGVRDQVLSSVSNTYNFVHSSMSNYVEEVRFRTSLRYRPVFTSSSSASSPSHSNVSTNEHSNLETFPSPPVFHGNLSASYYRVSGVPFLELPDGFRYGLGDDFGYGVIESISSLCVVCGGVKYRLVRPSVSSSVAPPVSVARSSSLSSTPEMEIKPL